MPNNFESNITRKLAKIFLTAFESARVLSKNVNTQLLDDKFSPDSGDTVDFKRPTDYRVSRTTDGDVSGETKSDIITGKATGTVQNWFTVFVDYKNVDEALRLDQKGMPGQKNTILGPMATRIVTDLEVDFADFMMKNCALLAGVHTEAVNAWSDIAEANAVLAANGVPKDKQWNYTINPYTQSALADIQRSLGAVDPLVSEAHKAAIIAQNFGGMKVMAATTLSTYTTPAGADRAGTLSSAPDVTYVTAKDSMTQVLPVTAFQANLVVQAGDVIQVTGRNRLNLSTRKVVVNGSQANVLWTGVVTAAVTLNGSGAGNLVVTGPGIFETLGQYNTTDTALASGDVVTLLGAASTLFQPNLFWHPDAFSIGSVKIPKLHSTDTQATTEDGLMFRVSLGVGFLENKNKVRIDFLPAYSVLNPFFAGHGYGLA